MTTRNGPTKANPVTADSAPRVHLVVQAGRESESRIRCRRVVTLLGSRVGCKVTLRHGRVSPVHVAIVNNGSDVLAVDLVTKTGTLLNGLKMEHEQLSNQDTLSIRPWEFRVDIEKPTHSGEADVHPFGLEPAPHVVALEHTATGRILQPSRAVCVIGRRNGCDITISDSQVSRAHALLLTYFGRPAIFDLLSNNETSVNDEPVEFHLLKNDDVITIGESRFRVRLVDSAIGERTPKNDKAAEMPVAVSSENPRSDLVDIRSTEKKRPWRIADDLEKATRKR